MAWQTASRRRRLNCGSEFERRNDGKLPADWKMAIAAARAEFIASGKEMRPRFRQRRRTRPSRRRHPELLGGSADLTPSNNTKAKGMIEIKPGEYTAPICITACASTACQLP